MYLTRGEAPDTVVAPDHTTKCSRMGRLGSIRPSSTSLTSHRGWWRGGATRRCQGDPRCCTQKGGKTQDDTEITAPQIPKPKIPTTFVHGREGRAKSRRGSNESPRGSRWSPLSAYAHWLRPSVGCSRFLLQTLSRDTVLEVDLTTPRPLSINQSRKPICMVAEQMSPWLSDKTC